jgi:hypothetical protein
MDNEYKIVKPKSGMTVRFPRTYGILPDKGAKVPWTGPDGRYWRRRVTCKDVQIIKKIESAKEEKLKKKDSFFEKNDGGYR